ncbi:hypothetical protein HON36_00780 [Candidatus Parcubacteria bacterium]|nr:hypothetical protein [Candidatus Parcubacteria bacterium]
MPGFDPETSSQPENKEEKQPNTTEKPVVERAEIKKEEVVKFELQKIIDGVEKGHATPEEMWDFLHNAESAFHGVDADEAVQAEWKAKTTELRYVIQSLKEQYRDVPQDLRMVEKEARPTDAPELARDLLGILES